MFEEDDDPGIGLGELEDFDDDEEAYGDEWDDEDDDGDD